MRLGKREEQTPSLLRLKAAELLAIAETTKSPGVAAEARKFADRCIARAIQLEQEGADPPKAIEIGA